MNYLVNLIFASLASYGIAILLTKMDGPSDIFEHLRSKLGAYSYGADGRPDSPSGRFISCPYCVSLWFSVWFTLVFFPINIEEFVNVFPVIGLTFLILTLSEK